MQKPFIVAAAVAAGVISFAFASQDSMAASLRADQGTPVVKQVAATTPAKKVTKVTKTVKASKRAKVTKAPKVASTAKATKTVSAKSAVEPCPYLFGCSKDAKTTANAKAGKSVKTAKAKTKVIYDTITTASITPGAVKPSISGAGSRYSTIVSRYAAAYGVPVSLAHAVIKVESNYQPGMVGRAGEIGLMQIKPATARMMGYSGSAKGLHNPETNIKYGMKYLGMARELGGGSTCGTILKYNAGHGAKRMNPTSSAYCRKVVAQIGGAG
ncbi:MAG TPA: transglycosylase SLT domain-containing protein [Mesorhizobium sp.]|jgi:soluble lytic murein transglycosylase-like protein|uniref:lytic transglycosylase domain-containing protein n=1 Tax=Mesorhizobium sp. TaxID=1871066 RepID=UPI002DDD21A7|nr:transglycosylase SLT domain-containing protein [Mesorhizobium sp.]HEV2507613.1 transglycosylase SLT domain-containing protein [Mesorhizobium sp.]